MRPTWGCAPSAEVRRKRPAMGSVPPSGRSTCWKYFRASICGDCTTWGISQHRAERLVTALCFEEHLHRVGVADPLAEDAHNVRQVPDHCEHVRVFFFIRKVLGAHPLQHPGKQRACEVRGQR